MPAEDHQVALYRHFAADGRLLYVGVSLCVAGRLRQHRIGATWYKEISSITVEWHPDKATAHRAENTAVIKERPLHNEALGGLRTAPWDVTDYLSSISDTAAYLSTWLEDGSQQEFLAALNTVARAHGMSLLAKNTGLSRETLYKALSDEGNPTMETLFKVTKALGLQLTVKVPEPA